MNDNLNKSQPSKTTLRQKLLAFLIPLFLYGFFLSVLCAPSTVRGEPQCTPMFKEINIIWTIFVFFVIWFIFAFPSSGIVIYLKNITNIFKTNPSKKRSAFLFRKFINMLFWSTLICFSVGISVYASLSSGYSKGTIKFIIVILIMSSIYSVLYIIGYSKNKHH